MTIRDKECDCKMLDKVMAKSDGKEVHATG